MSSNYSYGDDPSANAFDTSNFDMWGNPLGNAAFWESPYSQRKQGQMGQSRFRGQRGGFRPMPSSNSESAVAAQKEFDKQLQTATPRPSGSSENEDGSKEPTNPDIEAPNDGQGSHSDDYEARKKAAFAPGDALRKKGDEYLNEKFLGIIPTPDASNFKRDRAYRQAAELDAQNLARWRVEHPEDFQPTKPVRTWNKLNDSTLYRQTGDEPEFRTVPGADSGGGSGKTPHFKTEQGTGQVNVWQNGEFRPAMRKVKKWITNADDSDELVDYNEPMVEKDPEGVKSIKTITDDQGNVTEERTLNSGAVKTVVQEGAGKKTKEQRTRYRIATVIGDDGKPIEGRINVETNQFEPTTSPSGKPVEPPPKASSGSREPSNADVRALDKELAANPQYQKLLEKDPAAAESARQVYFNKKGIKAQRTQVGGGYTYSRNQPSQSGFQPMPSAAQGGQPVPSREPTVSGPKTLVDNGPAGGPANRAPAENLMKPPAPPEIRDKVVRSGYSKTAGKWFYQTSDGKTFDQNGRQVK